ncbi:MAG: thioredoxin family protein [Balneolaceae bacterium]|nr:MAG: thioredoxin family protein [Balneolaceae bacterium]
MKTILFLIFLFFPATAFWGSNNKPPAETALDEPFAWMSLEQAHIEAASTGKTIMIFVEAEWCGICKQMRKNVFPQQNIQNLVNATILPVTIDLDSREPVVFNGETMTERNFARKIRVSATPTTLFMDADGQVIAHQTGYVPADRFEALLNFIRSDDFGKMHFDDYFNSLRID